MCVRACVFILLALNSRWNLLGLVPNSSKNVNKHLLKITSSQSNYFIHLIDLEYYPAKSLAGTL